MIFLNDKRLICVKKHLKRGYFLLLMFVMARMETENEKFVAPPCSGILPFPCPRYSIVSPNFRFSMTTNYIFVTGGSYPLLGKGIAAASPSASHS